MSRRELITLPSKTYANPIYISKLTKMASSFCSTQKQLMMMMIVALIFMVSSSSAGNLNQELDITWGDGRAKILNNADLLTLSLDKASGSGFQSKNGYLFGKIDMQLKLVHGNSAGTVTAYYVRVYIYIHIYLVNCLSLFLSLSP